MSYIKTPYISEDLVEEFMVLGIQGDMLREMIKFKDVQFGLKNLNILSYNEKMYPENPFEALAECALNDICCVVVGGMPERDNYKKWTGSAYSYDVKNHITRLHEKIIADFYAPKFDSGLIDPRNIRLQENGFLLLHNALSVTEQHPFLCKDFWEPIIFRILNYVSNMDHDIPIIFTNNTAEQIFKMATIESRNKFVLGLFEGKAVPDSPRIFSYVEDIINVGRTATTEIRLLDLIRK